MLIWLFAIISTPKKATGVALTHFIISVTGVVVVGVDVLPPPPPPAEDGVEIVAVSVAIAFPVIAILLSIVSATAVLTTVCSHLEAIKSLKVIFITSFPFSLILAV